MLSEAKAKTILPNQGSKTNDITKRNQNKTLNEKETNFAIDKQKEKKGENQTLLNQRHLDLYRVLSLSKLRLGVWQTKVQAKGKKKLPNGQQQHTNRKKSDAKNAYCGRVNTNTNVTKRI